MRNMAKYGLKCAIASVVGLLALSAFTLLATPNVSAADHATAVVGTVTDAEDSPVPGASVTVNMKDGETIITTKSDTTDENGNYTTLFLEGEWEVTYTIQVIATYNSQQESVSEDAQDLMLQTFDIQFNFAIPDFGSEIGLVVAGCAIGLVAAVMVVWKRK